MKRKKKPTFKPPNAGGKRGKKRVKERWRRPKGVGNKQRVKKRSAGARPKIGYKNPESIRGLHPSGKREVLIHNVAEVEAQRGGDVVLRIAHAVGKRKRLAILEKAKELGLRVLNPGRRVLEALKADTKKAEEKAQEAGEKAEKAEKEGEKA